MKRSRPRGPVRARSIDLAGASCLSVRAWWRGVAFARGSDRERCGKRRFKSNSPTRLLHSISTSTSTCSHARADWHGAPPLARFSRGRSQRKRVRSARLESFPPSRPRRPSRLPRFPVRSSALDVRCVEVMLSSPTRSHAGPKSLEASKVIDSFQDNRTHVVVAGAFP